MNIKEDIKPISYVKTHTAEIIKNINENHRPIIITQNGEAKGVFIDTHSYQKMKDTISMMKLIILAESDVASGKVTPQKEVLKKLEKKFKNKK